jgi:hypothetical protein
VIVFLLDKVLPPSRRLFVGATAAIGGADACTNPEAAAYDLYDCGYCSMYGNADLDCDVCYYTQCGEVSAGTLLCLLDT